ncbi:putative taxadien-5-alpha-ol O-acetyltransferase [Medicago truncatula]|uniref:Putative taxadien-5-alpha-ol O-acetyltransferase n=1 Tax=Medicago truncatula TaxID=3880 RepID=A0A396HCU1_MEDTR|nr:putative taxadien-5-alpha-ol O-acetyltransferase [Medicago truncatula]
MYVQTSMEYNLKRIMGAIRVLSSDIIKAPTSADQEIDLTPWDLQFLLIAPTKIGLFYDHSLVVNQIERLRHSLSSVLAFFQPLAGRLKMTENEDNNVSCSITCNNAGVLFVHAAIEDTRDVDIVGPTYLPLIVHSFFPFNGARNYEGISKPLLAVQVTELVGGVFIGFRFNHVVTGGKSMWHFISSWAEISRGCCNQISKLPSLERCFQMIFSVPYDFLPQWSLKIITLMG